MNRKQKIRIGVVGAGLAGSELTLRLANWGHSVTLFEKKRISPNKAQTGAHFAELVCTNSLKSISLESGHGLLKWEMNKLGSTLLEMAKAFAVPAGEALAVDRELFSKAMTEKIQSHSHVRVLDMEVSDPEKIKEDFDLDVVVLATGPLTGKGLENWIKVNLSSENLYFYDAIAPVVEADSLDMTKLYFKDRYAEPGETGNYLNAPLTKSEYESFVNELLQSKKVPANDEEEFRFFESCLPIDVMCERGPETLRFSCMKPVGLELPDGKRPYAVVQLRKENLLGDAYNLVGFQNKLTYSEQVRVFRLIPGLENANFLHLGSVHRNTFLHSKNILKRDFSSTKFPWLYVAGQLSGVEGYTESAAMGLYVAYQIHFHHHGKEDLFFPLETMMGALVNYVMTAEKPIPSNVHFGLLPPLDTGVTLKKIQKKQKKGLLSSRAQTVFDQFLKEISC